MTAPRAWLATVGVVAVCIPEGPDASGSSCGYSETPARPPAKGAVLWSKTDQGPPRRLPSMADLAGMQPLAYRGERVRLAQPLGELSTGELRR
jgi:hypothetical protein